MTLWVVATGDGANAGRDCLRFAACIAASAEFISASVLVASLASRSRMGFPTRVLANHLAAFILSPELHCSSIGVPTAVSGVGIHNCDESALPLELNKL